MKTGFFSQNLKDLEARGLRRTLKNFIRGQGARMMLEGQEVLNFSSNDYLGLAADSRICAAAAEAMGHYGFGSGASRLVCGNFDAHRELEEAIAHFKGTESALVFNTGYMANVGILASLCDRNDVIFSDKLNHASIVDGIVLSRAQLKRYPHKDIGALEGLLKAARISGKKLIVTDGVFSMDGDIAPLPALAALAERSGASLMVDDAHGFGVLGRTGRGTVEHFDLHDDVDIQMGTLSKAVGSLGAYVCGKKEMIDFFLNRARSFVYTTALPPAVCAASLMALKIIGAEPQLRQRLWANTAQMRQGLAALGFDTMGSETPIIPVLVKDAVAAASAAAAVEFSKRLLSKGIFVPAIRPPTVPEGTARLRVTVTAGHAREDINHALDAFHRTGKDLCLI